MQDDVTGQINKFIVPFVFQIMALSAIIMEKIYKKLIYIDKLGKLVYLIAILCPNVEMLVKMTTQISLLGYKGLYNLTLIREVVKTSRRT